MKILKKADYEAMIAESRDRRMDWWRQARFGMFVHFGLYSIIGRHEWVMSMEGIDKEEYEADPDELMMMALDAGAEDFADEEDSYEIITAPEDFETVREALEEKKIPMLEAEVTMIPQTWVELKDDNDIKMITRTLDLLDEDDDVQNVYHNWDE